jgi:HK97 family phage major capsid protein
MRLKQLIAEFEAKNAELDALFAKGSEATDEDRARIKALDGELDGLKTQIEEAKAEEDLKARQEARKSFLNDPVLKGVKMPEAPAEETDETKALAEAGEASSTYKCRVPAVVRKVKVTAFKGTNAVDKAYGFGRFVLAATMGDTKSVRWCEENGLGDALKAQSEGSNTQGGVLVPPQFDSDIIDLREQYGDFRKYSKISIMTSDTKMVPRRTAGLTAYAVGEVEAATESTKTWDQVNLVAKDFAVLSYFSKNLSDDAIIDIGNDLAEEMAYAHAVKEDQCGFLGDGTSTYNGIRGITSKFQWLVESVGGTWTTDAHKLYAAGIVTASDETWGGITLADLNRVKGRLPKYARQVDCAWYCSEQFKDQVIERLLLAAGGITDAMIAQGIEYKLLGFPIRTVQILPTETAVSQIPLIFGSLRLGTLFGDRRQTVIDVSTHFRFSNRQVAMQATERYDINVHSIGNAHASDPTQRVPGPIVALATLNA